MKTFIKTLLWMAVLVAAAAYAGQKYVLRAWNGRDTLLKQEVVKTLRQLFPQAELELDEVQYDFGHDIVLTGFALTPATENTPIVRLPETVLHINRDALIDRQQLEIQKVIVKSPRIELVRARDGGWNWQSLLPSVGQEKGALPEFLLEDGTVIVRVEQAPGIPPGVLLLEHVDIQLLPSGKRQFQISATSRCEHTDGIKLEGRWHVDQQTGQLDGEFTKITAGQELVGVVASFVPEVRTKLAECEEKFLALLATPSNGPGGSPFAMPGPARTAGAADSILGLRATFNVNFRVTRPEPNTIPMFRVAMKIADGEITNPALPFPLQDLRGKLYADNDRFEILEPLTARNGVTSVTIGGKLEGREAGYPGRIELTVNNVICDHRLRSRLSAGFGRIYEAHHPIGDINMHAFLVHEDGQWRPEGLLVTAKDCSVKHDAFPYPIEHASGSIQQQGRDLIIDVRGMAGSQPITLDGTVANPGPNATVLLNIRGSNLPIDETFLNACNPQIQAAIRKMRLTGLMDGQVRLTKAPQQPFVPIIDAVLRDGTLNYEAFPYLVEGITGRLTAVGPNFEFKELSGRHGSTRIAAEGRYSKLNNSVGELKLRIVTKAAALDDALRRAVPASLQRVWGEFNPTGLVDAVAEVNWLTGQSAVVRLPSLELSNGSATLKSLPYRLDNLRGSFSYGPDGKGLPFLLAKSIQGRHGEMQLSATGWQSLDADGDWQAHCDKFTIENLTPNQELLNALSQLPGLRQLFANLDPAQLLKMDGVMDFRGSSDPGVPITAAWDMDTYFSGGTIHTGLDFKNLRGKVNARGEWDGEELKKFTGKVDLASARILDYDLTDISGPFRVVKGTLMFGAGDSQRARGPIVDNRDRITARVFDGMLLLDGAATLTEQPSYNVVMQLRNARLERFAALHAPKQRDLKGITNGWVQLEGKGSTAQGVTGRGHIDIKPAALLDMPLMLQMYRGLSFTPPEDYAFNEASLDFGIKFGRFICQRIRLDGDAIAFEGSGTVDFDSNTNLTFYSRMGRNQVPIPIVHELVGEATKGWVRIFVTGKLSQPRTKIETLKGPDESLKDFFDFLRTAPQPVFPIGQDLLPRGLGRQ